jgi:hypothetical protein
MLDLICQLVDVVLDRDDPHHLSELHLKTIRLLELRLERLEQRLPTIGLEFEPQQAAHIIALGELFRLAGLIYLHRMAKAESWDSVPLLLSKAYDLLRELEVCEPPWPLFVIGMEARTDDERLLILTIMKKSIERRPLGNMSLVNRMILAAWVQQDLHSGANVDPLTIYTEVISGNRVPPSFTL